MVGKEVRNQKKKQKKERLKNQPLEAQIRDDELPKQRNRQKQKKKKDEDEDQVTFIEKGITQKILGSAKDQLEEEEEEEYMEEEEDSANLSKKFGKMRRELEEEDDDELSDAESQIDMQEELERITEEDERALEMFMSTEEPKRVTLADIIMEKIKEKEQGIQSSVEEQVTKQLDPKVVSVYSGVGQLMSRYTSGKIPKAFKIIPSLNNWEEILYLTNPEKWTPVAMRQATRLFASNLNAKMAQRFYSLVLLPRVIEDIKEHKKLNYHLYLALKKALYKPAAFYKGILLPLCESGRCTLREATIVGSVLSKVSIPVLHSSAAIMKIAEMEYSGANSLFLRVLLNKKYALPYRVIDVLVSHFMQTAKDPRKLPVLWQEALLVFVQRYKTDLLPEQKAALRNAIKQQNHPYFSEEIRRELANSKNRGEAEQNIVEMDMITS